MPGLFCFWGKKEKALPQRTQRATEYTEIRQWERQVKRFVLLGLVMGCGAVMAAGAGLQHTVSVTLNYDFSVDNACSASVTTGCLKQFKIYDITGGGTR